MKKIMFNDEYGLAQSVLDGKCEDFIMHEPIDADCQNPLVYWV